MTFVLVKGLRDGRRLKESERHLATLECPACGSPFGSEAAHQAFHPPRPPKRPLTELIFVDDLGFSSVHCTSCNADVLYHRRAARLQWKGAIEAHGEADA